MALDCSKQRYSVKLIENRPVKADGDLSDMPSVAFGADPACGLKLDAASCAASLRELCGGKLQALVAGAPADARAGAPGGVDRAKQAQAVIAHVVSQVSGALHMGERTVFGVAVFDVLSFFTALDRDNSGALDPLEVALGLKRLDVAISPDDIALFIAELDTDRDGLVSVDELLQLFGARPRALAAEDSGAAEEPEPERSWAEGAGGRPPAGQPRRAPPALGPGAAEPPAPARAAGAAPRLAEGVAAEGAGGLGGGLVEKARRVAELRRELARRRARIGLLQRALGGPSGVPSAGGAPGPAGRL